ncbi:TerD family protein, partial [Streptomyces sp. URMC 126]|uniref:TerD family protein n=1 Tax=Streptomyces sp. URMC 126 TaxID=3423401 RepID=UPI003F1ADB62
MTVELVRGQNHPLTESRLEIRVSAGDPVVVGAALGGPDGRVAGAGQVARPGSPRLPGVEAPDGVAPAQRLTVELDALPDSVHRVHVLLALPPGGRGPARFGVTAAPFLALSGAGGDDVASFTVTELDAETALVALELYRRQGAWRVRAVGQGYAGGLAELFHDLGVDGAAELAAGVEAETAGSAAVLSARQSSARHAGSGCRHAGTAVDWPADHAVPEAPPAAPQAVPASETPSPAGPVDYRHPRRRATEP